MKLQNDSVVIRFFDALILVCRQLLPIIFLVSAGLFLSCNTYSKVVMGEFANKKFPREDIQWFEYDPVARQFVYTFLRNEGLGDLLKISTDSLEKLVSLEWQGDKFVQDAGISRISDFGKTKRSKPVSQQVEMPRQAMVKELVIGSTMDFTRGARDLSLAVQRGIELAFDTEKIPGLHIRFIALDDAYMPSQAYENVRKLVEKHAVSFLLSSVGSPTFAAYVDLVRKGLVVAMFPIPGISYERTEENKMKYCIHLRPSYADEAYVVMQYVMSTREMQKVAVFYQEDEFGLACLQGLTEAAGKNDVKIIKLPYVRNDMNFDTQIKTIKDSNARFVALFATPLAARQFLEQMGDEAVRRFIFFGISDLGGLTFKRMVSTKGIQIITSHVVPDPETSTLPLVEEFRGKAKKADLALDSFALEGYMGAAIITDMLKKIDGEISKDSLIYEIEKLKNYDLKGFLLNFDGRTRQLSNKVWIEDGHGPWEEHYR